MSSLFHTLAMRAEQAWDRLRPPQEVSHPYIDPFIGYATPHGVHVRGRVLNSNPVAAVPRAPSMWNNLRNMAARFTTDEIAGIAVEAGGVGAATDEEGYFSIELPIRFRDFEAVEARLLDHEARATLPIITPDTRAQYGIISDIDDTIIRTGAWSLGRNIFNTMTGNAASRHVFPDAAEFIKTLHNGINPVFFVSSSPWNLHAFLLEVFRQNGVVPGPLFLRDLGISHDKFIKGTHGGHKGAMIDTILAANPDLTFVLLGDSGQHDPAVYLDAIQRHPGRFRAAWFRIAGQTPGAEVHAQLRRIREAGAEAHAVKAFPSDDDATGIMRILGQETRTMRSGA